MKKTVQYLLSLFLAAVMLLASCTDDVSFSSSPAHTLTFSSDTISFDTLFTTVGSATSGLKVYNRNSDALRISSVRLAGGDSSPFRVNVDGQYASQVNDLEIRKGDSIYVFVEVTLPENEAEMPLLSEDSLLFSLESGVQQSVKLLAYGRDVTFLRGTVIESDETLSAGHYVVYDSLMVAPDATLTINPGVTLYFHSRAFLKVGGTLIAEGTKEQPIVMRGDRTDNMFSYLPYDRIPGQWDGITILATSNDNHLRHCDIHSANYGIKVEQGDTARMRLVVENSRIENFHGNGIEAVNSRIDVANSLIANAGGNCVKIVGGRVRFVHCTIANFYVWKVRDVAVALHNSIEGTPAPLREAYFGNCIIEGSKDDELMGYLSTLGDTVPDCINYRFHSSLINTIDSEDENFYNIVYDSAEVEPFAAENFMMVDHDIFMYDYHLSELSKARGIALDSLSALYPFDLDGIARPLNGADAGCFQFVPKSEEEENF